MRHLASAKIAHELLISKELRRGEATRSTTDGLSLYLAKRSRGSYLLILDAKLLGDVIGESRAVNDDVHRLTLDEVV